MTLRTSGAFFFALCVSWCSHMGLCRCPMLCEFDEVERSEWNSFHPQKTHLYRWRCMCSSNLSGLSVLHGAKSLLTLVSFSRWWHKKCLHCKKTPNLKNGPYCEYFLWWEMLCVSMCVFFNVEKGPCDYRAKVLWIIEWKAQRETSATQMFQA